MSLYGGVYDIYQGVKFVNVIGSSDDPKVTETDAGISDSQSRLSWLQLWGTKTGLGTQRIPCMACNANHASVGGHIVLRGSVSSDAPRSHRQLAKSNRVFIAPICSVCNSRDYSDTMHNEYVFQAQYSGKVVHLWAFFEDSVLPYSMFSDAAWESDSVLELEESNYAQNLADRRETEAQLNYVDAFLLSASPSSMPSFRSAHSRPSRIRRSAQSSRYLYY